MSLDVRELIRQLRAGKGNRAIARTLSLSRKTVVRYRKVARAEGWLEGSLPPIEELDRRLKEMMPPSNLPRQPFKAAPYKTAIEGLREKGLTVAALYERLCENHDYTGSYSALRRYVIHLEGRHPEGYIRIETAPGEEAQVDFGSAGKMIDPQTGELRKAWAFVMTLSHSRHQYATFVFDQKVLRSEVREAQLPGRAGLDADH